MKRRILLQFLFASLAAIPVKLRGQTASISAADQVRLRAVAEVVLPGEIGASGVDRVVTAFITWARGYRAGAETDYGYGFPRLRKLPPSPLSAYTAQLDALDRQARMQNYSLADLPLDQRRALVSAAIVDAKIERLPARPDGGHLATDLMGFYFHGIEANDTAYRAHIGRDTCRGLAGSENRPAPLKRGNDANL